MNKFLKIYYLSIKKRSYSLYNLKAKSLKTTESFTRSTSELDDLIRF